jgi:hypothetical protein
VSGAISPLVVLADLDARLATSPHGGQTTAVLAVVRPAGVIGASVGVSECWLVTADDCRVLTSSQRRKPLLGASTAVVTAFGAPSGTFVVGSDGLFLYVARERLLAIVRARPAR